MATQCIWCDGGLWGRRLLGATCTLDKWLLLLKQVSAIVPERKVFALGFGNNVIQSQSRRVGKHRHYGGTMAEPCQKKGLPHKNLVHGA